MKRWILLVLTLTMVLLAACAVEVPEKTETPPVPERKDLRLIEFSSPF
jgi:hypothetical protein